MSPRGRRLFTAALAVAGGCVAVFVLSGGLARAVGVPDQVDASTTTPAAHTGPTTTLPTTVSSSTTVSPTTAVTTSTTVHSTSTTSRSRTTVAPTYRTTYPTYQYGTSTTTTTSSTTTTTVAPIAGQVPAAPATVPLATKGTNGHVSSVFPVLSGVGLFIALVIGSGRFFVTRSGSADRRPPSDDES